MKAPRLRKWVARGSNLVNLYLSLLEVFPPDFISRYSYFFLLLTMCYSCILLESLWCSALTLQVSL